MFLKIFKCAGFNNYVEFSLNHNFHDDIQEINEKRAEGKIETVGRFV